jgi:hypothetical protein
MFVQQLFDGDNFFSEGDLPVNRLWIQIVARKKKRLIDAVRKRKDTCMEG